MGLSLKLAVLSATVFSTAVMFNHLSPFVTTNLAISDLPTVWTSLISWLKPPYLYVIINCIIITIVASSRLQSKIDGSDHSPLTTFPTPALIIPTEPVKVVFPVELPLVHEPEVPFQGMVLGNEPVNIAGTGYNGESEVFEVPVDEFRTPQFTDEDMKIAKEAYEEIKKTARVDKSVISTSALTPSDMNQVGRLSFPMEKPPASARFSHRKPAKAAPDGGRALGVAKAKRQDTLETTWKAITEGRSVPLTRHLRKSDTWETQGPRRETRNSEEFSTDNKMSKSDTFDVNSSRVVGGGGGRKAVKPPAPPSKLKRSGGSGRLRKEPSAGQEELNRRVEAFIKKFNEDMKLQRQESLNQFMEMINRGAH